MQPRAGDQDVRGLALLVRNGMAAWMRCVGESDARAWASPDSPTTASCTEVRSLGIEQMLVNIVAAMTLAHAKEIFA